MRTEEQPTAIAAMCLRRTFKGGIEAVRDIDLAVSAGEVFGFLGPNGAGKTTTVRMLCTLLPPTSGRATVAGLDVVGDGAAVRRSIGVAFSGRVRYISCGVIGGLLSCREHVASPVDLIRCAATALVRRRT